MFLPWPARIRFSLTLGLCRCGDKAEDELYRLCALVLMDTFEHSPTETTVAKVTTSKIMRDKLCATVVILA